MPNYRYTDGNEIITVEHPMEWGGTIYAGSGVQMWRLPSKVAGVHWAVGLSPSEAEQRPQALTDHIRNADRKRGEYLENKEND